MLENQTRIPAARDISRWLQSHRDFTNRKYCITREPDAAKYVKLYYNVVTLQRRRPENGNNF